jgi:hypothetical protein
VKFPSLPPIASQSGAMSHEELGKDTDGKAQIMSGWRRSLEGEGELGAGGRPTTRTVGGRRTAGTGVVAAVAGGMCSRVEKVGDDRSRRCFLSFLPLCVLNR